MAGSKWGTAGEFRKKFRWLLRRDDIIAPNTSPLLEYVDQRLLLQNRELIRLGTSYGGWLIPSNSGLSSDSVCYTAGAGEDISFDCALVSLFHCRVRIVDPTPRAVAHFRQLEAAVGEGLRFPINNSSTEFYDITKADLTRLSFLPFGLADKDAQIKFFFPVNPAHVSCSAVNLQKTADYFTAQCYRLSTLIGKQGDSKVDLLKMDIEGAEYSVIADVVASNLLPRLLLVEFDEAHTPLDGDAGLRIGEHIRQLVQAGMRCIAVEGCNATFVRT